MQVTILKSTGIWYRGISNKNEIIDCRVKGNFRIKGIKSTNPIAVGDRVEVKKEAKDWIIIELCDRKNYVIRKSVNLSKQTHVLAANVDQVFLMVTIKKPNTTTEFIDRFLLTAEAYDIPAILLINKKDIYNKQDLAQVEKLCSTYSKVGYLCYVISSLSDNIDFLTKHLKDKVTIVVGHSGVGKSSLINTIEPTLNLKTSKISAYHKQGKHTTTFAEMHPLKKGGFVIDTPGIRGFGLVDIKKEELTDFFPEMFKIKHNCKFNNCLHINEPRCAVLLEVKNGNIPESRYKNYIKILNNSDENYR